MMHLISQQNVFYLDFNRKLNQGMVQLLGTGLMGFICCLFVRVDRGYTVSWLDTKSICGDIHDLVTPVSNDAPHQPANYFVCLSDFDGKLNQRIVQLLGTGSMGFICFLWVDFVWRRNFRRKEVLLEAGSRTRQQALPSPSVEMWLVKLSIWGTIYTDCYSRLTKIIIRGQYSNSNILCRWYEVHSFDQNMKTLRSHIKIFYAD